MPRVSPEQLIRQFHENGLKLLLYDPANVRDLVTLRDPARAARIDFARLTVDPTSYVAADYRYNDPSGACSPRAPELYELIGNSIRSDTRRREVQTIMETMADYLRAEGRRDGEIHSRQQTLVRQLRRRFGRVPRATEQLIRATQDTARLDSWLDNFVTAQTLADVGIAAQAEGEKGTA